VVVVAAYLYCWCIGVRRRNAESWDSLLARLRPGWNARELTDLDFSNDEPNLSTVVYWRRLWAARGLWAMYTNAGIMLEIANYADRNGRSVDQELLAVLRSDALEVRASVLKTVVSYACGAMRESICMSALRAEAAYAEMTEEMRALLEKNIGEAVPAFVAAM
jgi:hypothetical protein